MEIRKISLPVVHTDDLERICVKHDKFWSFKRKYFLINSYNDKVAIIYLNYFERMGWFFQNLFGVKNGDKFEKIFSSKDVRIIKSKEVVSKIQKVVNKCPNSIPEVSKKEEKKKSAETSPVISPIVSQPLMDLEAVERERQRDLQNHSSELWECVGRKEAPYGGFLYQFEAREDFNNQISLKLTTPYYLQQQSDANANKKNAEIYPAVEVRALELGILLDNKKQIERLRSIANVETEVTSNHSSTLNEIGYGYHYSEITNEVKIEVPDLEALQKGWKHFQNSHPEMDLPDFDVIDSLGVADDVTFANAYIEHDALLSSGKEFIHDHFAHITTRLEYMQKGKKVYKAEKKRLLKLIDNIRQAIQEAEKCEEPNGIIHKEREKFNFIIGMLTDLLFGGNRESVNQETIEKWLTQPLSFGFKAWNNYLEKRFGAGFTIESLSNLWKEVRRLVPFEANTTN